MTKFSVNRSDSSGFSTMSRLFNTEADAEKEVSKQRKEEPEAEFWSELFTICDDVKRTIYYNKKRNKNEYK